jgi:hypothetical protein
MLPGDRRRVPAPADDPSALLSAHRSRGRDQMTNPQHRPSPPARKRTPRDASTTPLNDPTEHHRPYNRRTPGPRRQVDERWLDRYRGWVYGLGYGAQLGVGVTTVIVSSAVYVVPVAAFLSARPSTGGAIGAVAGALSRRERAHRRPGRDAGAAGRVPCPDARRGAAGSRGDAARSTGTRGRVGCGGDLT